MLMRGHAKELSPRKKKKIPKLSQTGSSLERTGEQGEERRRPQEVRAAGPHAVHGEPCRCPRPREPCRCLPYVHGWGRLS